MWKTRYVLILNSKYWLLNTALAEPTKEVLQEPHFTINTPNFIAL